MNRPSLLHMILACAVVAFSTVAFGGAAPGGQFVVTGSMLSPRGLHAAAALDDGRVLIVGGLADFGVTLESTELYDPDTDAFNAGPSMNEARGAPIVVKLADGNVLITGGRGGVRGEDIFTTSYLFDPATDTLSPTGTMNTARYAAAAVSLNDGTVLIAGGFNFDDGPLASAEIYHPDSGTFSNVADIMADPRTSFAIRLLDGRVLILGGTNESGPLASAELYDPATGQFTPTGSLAVANGGPSLALLPDGRVLVAGGSDINGDYIAEAQIYDPQTGIFSATGSLAYPRDNQSAAVLPDGRVAIIGGFHLPAQATEACTAIAEIYDPATGMFSDSDIMNMPRGDPSVTVMGSGDVLVAGGSPCTDEFPLASATAELFVPETTDLIFADGFDSAPSPLVSNYDDLSEGFLGSEYTYDGLSYHDVNGLAGVFPDGSIFNADDNGDQLIVENAALFYNDFRDFGSTPNSLTFGTSFVPGDNVSIGALVQVSIDLPQPAHGVALDLAYYENGPWGGIEYHLDALDGGSVVGSDTFIIANGGGRDNAAVAQLQISGVAFDSLHLYATYNGQPSAPRGMIDDLTITP